MIYNIAYASQLALFILFIINSSAARVTQTSVCEYVNIENETRLQVCPLGCCKKFNIIHDDEVCCKVDAIKISADKAVNLNVAKIHNLNHYKLSQGAIAGIVIGSNLSTLIGVFVLLLIIYLIARKAYIKRLEPKVPSNYYWPFKYPHLPSIADKLPSQHIGIYNHKHDNASIIVEKTSPKAHLYNPNEFNINPNNLYVVSNQAAAFTHPNVQQTLSATSTLTTNEANNNYKSYSTILKTHKN